MVQLAHISRVISGAPYLILVLNTMQAAPYLELVLHTMQHAKEPGGRIFKVFQTAHLALPHKMSP